MEFYAVFNKATGLWETAKVKAKAVGRKYGPAAVTAVVGTASLWAPEVLAAAAGTPASQEGKDMKAYMDDAKLVAAGAAGLLVVLFGIKIWKRLTGGA